MYIFCMMFGKNNIFLYYLKFEFILILFCLGFPAEWLEASPLDLQSADMDQRN